MTVHSVLITGIGGNIGQGVLKSLRAGKRKYHIVGTDMEPLSAGFSLVDSFYQTPRIGAQSFRNVLEKIAQKERIEAIYVCSPMELDFFSSHKIDLEIKLGVTIFVNPLRVVRIGSDKLETANFLRDAGLPYPETVLSTDTEGLDDLIIRFGFPLIVKPRVGFTSKNVFLVHSRKEITALCTVVSDLIVQRYLPDSGSEYTAATVSGVDKKARASIVLHRDLTQGTTYRAELVQDKTITDQIVRIAEALGAVGACNLQFRLVDGMVFVFEINPRFSGTCGIRYLYGFNDSEMVFDLLRLGLDVCQPELRPAVVLRYWNEIYIAGATFQSLRQSTAKHCGVETHIHNPFFLKSDQPTTYSDDTQIKHNEPPG